MSFETVNFKYKATDGTMKDAEVGLSQYQKASRAGMNLSQYLQSEYPDADTQQGTAFQQFATSMGFNLNPKAKFKNSSAHVLEGNAMIAGAVTAPDGQDRSIAGRLLMPEIVLGMQEMNLPQNTSPLRDALMSKVAMRTSVNSKTYYRPVVDSDTNRNFQQREIGQGATPDLLVKIATSERGYTIPTTSFGIEITDEALASTTLDQIGMMIRSARRSIDNKSVYRWIDRIVNGDAQHCITALTPVNLSTFDSTITGSEVTQTAWLKALLDGQEYWEADTMLATKNSFLAIQNRGQRPTVSDDTGRDNRLNAGMNLMNVALETIDTIMVNKDAALGGAGNFLLFDSQQSLEYAQNVSASYEAVERYVMRRAEQMRYDMAEEMFRWRDDAMMLVSRA